MDSWIVQMCTVTSRRQFLAWFFVLSIGIGFMGFNARYMRNFVKGPYPLQADDLMRITGGGWRTLVRPSSFAT